VLKKLLLGASVALLPCSSYSDDIVPYYGTTNNAANGTLNWVMSNILPDAAGLDINAVTYRYTPIKKTEDDMLVHVQNENASGTGYIFRETDDWSGIPGGIEIRKTVPVQPTNRSLWGDGSIEVEGTGTVQDANVVYSYKVDPCYDPQSNPNCPGYKVQIPDTPDIDLSNIYDTSIAEREQYNDEELYDSDESESEEEKKEREEEEEKDSKERLEKALAAAQTAGMFADALAASQMLDAMNLSMNMNAYYGKSIQGGTYKEAVQLVDKQIPENLNGLRNGLAQQLLHNQMVEMQYKK
jgi:hypothetical protein